MWALFPWFEEHGAGHIHPEDLENLRKADPYGKVFQVKGEKSGFEVIEYGDLDFRVKPDLLTEVPEPTFRIGDRVRVKGEQEPATVVEVLWHYSKQRPFFHLEVDGKRRSKRFWDEELEVA